MGAILCLGEMIEQYFSLEQPLGFSFQTLSSFAVNSLNFVVGVSSPCSQKIKQEGVSVFHI